MSALSPPEAKQATSLLAAIVARLLADDKGLLAMDESNATCNARFAPLGIAQTEASRRAWRELILTAPGLCDSIGGAILADETIRQATADGLPFVSLMARTGIVPGIKVDLGAKLMARHPGEKITEGLDGLRERLQDYAKLGACFAKWRGVIAIDGTGMPSRACIAANAHALARYAALCQDAGQDGERRLAMALWRRGEPTGLMLHSDRGSQYTSEDFQTLLKDQGITCSMSRRGDCWDNAAMESFFSTMKTERTARKIYRTRDNARTDVFDYIERFYNQRRKHSTLKMVSPVQFEQTSTV